MVKLFAVFNLDREISKNKTLWKNYHNTDALKIYLIITLNKH